jgi:hypothetical protein
VTAYLLVEHAEPSFNQTVGFNVVECTRIDCPSGPEFSTFYVGNSALGTMFGCWNASSFGMPIDGGNLVAVTFADNESGQLYSSGGTTVTSHGFVVRASGSFVVSGTGPFRVTVAARQGGRFSATIQGTVLAWTQA